jgi:hypothetical protein
MGNHPGCDRSALMWMGHSEERWGCGDGEKDLIRKERGKGPTIVYSPS